MLIKLYNISQQKSASQMNNNQMSVPEVLLEQLNFGVKIAQNNERLYLHIDYLRNLVTSIHQVYNKLSKKMTQISQEYQRKILSYKNPTGTVVISFIKSMCIVHMNLSNQLSNNTVALGIKNHKIVKNRQQIIKEKMQKIDQLLKDYLTKLKLYNQKQARFQEKCQYFNDYQKDVLKFYSLKANTELHEKLSRKQLLLRERMEQLYELKNDVKVGISELRASIKEYFEMSKSIIGEYRRLLLNLRKSINNNKRLYNEPIIEETSDYESSIKDFGLNLTKRSEKDKHSLNPQKSIANLRKDVIREYQKEMEIQELFEEFMSKMEAEILYSGESIDEIRCSKEYEKFNKDKLIMLEVLSLDSIKDIDQIINEIALFRQILLNLTSIFGQTRVLKQLKKYRGFNFNKFQEESAPFVDEEHNSTALLQAYKIIEDEFQENHHEYMTRFREKVLEIQQQTIHQYAREISQLDEDKNRKIKNNLFEKKYYQILMLPFFLNNEINAQFKMSSYLIKFSKLLSATKIQQITLELNGDTPSQNKSRMKVQTTCCGLFRKEVKLNYVDEYNCALKDGLVLIQGKLKLYQLYFSFKSSFNPKTLFGYTDLRIPKWDVIEAIEGKHLISTMLTIVTTHGNLEFTSFITNPMKVFMENFDNRHQAISMRAPTASELENIEEKFQSQFQKQLKKKNIFIDKLSTYLTEDQKNLSVSIQFHLLNEENIIQFFEIKIFQLENSLEYYFIHEENFQNKSMKNLLETISKDLINKTQQRETPSKRNLQFKNHRKSSNQDLSAHFQIDSCSIIEPRECNKLSFIKQPSFLIKKDLSQNHQSDRNFFQNFMNNDRSQASINPAMLTSNHHFVNSRVKENFNEGSPNKHKQQSTKIKESEVKSFGKLQGHLNESAKKSSLKQRNTSSTTQDFKTSNRLNINCTKNSEIKSVKNSSKSQVKSNRSSKEVKLSEYKYIFYILGVVFVLNLLIKSLN